MRRVIMSFDDGLKDFLKNAYPLLKKYGFRSSLNIVSSFAEQAEKNKMYMSVDEIRQLSSEGFEIALHSESHTRGITSKDFKICKLKISNWVNQVRFGAIIPYSQRIDKTLLSDLRDDGIIYCADCSGTDKGKTIRKKSLSVLKRLFNSKKMLKLRQNIGYIYNVKRVNGFFVFKRIPARRDNLPSDIENVIKLMKKNECITIAFHSILENLNDPCVYPDGAWTKTEFEEFLYFLKKRKIQVLTQMEIFDD